MGKLDAHHRAIRTQEPMTAHDNFLKYLC